MKERREKKRRSAGSWKAEPAALVRSKGRKIPQHAPERPYHTNTYLGPVERASNKYKLCPTKINLVEFSDQLKHDGFYDYHFYFGGTLVKCIVVISQINQSHDWSTQKHTCALL